MNFDITLDDFVNYILMFWFVAMPVGLVALGWLCYLLQRQISYSRQTLINNNIINVARHNGNDTHVASLIKVLQGHTAAIAKLEETVNRDNWGMPKIYDISEDQKEWNDVVAKALKKVGLCKPPKSLKEKVIAASKRNGKRGKTS